MKVYEAASIRNVALVGHGGSGKTQLASAILSVGGIIGIALGAGIGWTVHLASGFPISLPWWSFAIGLGFSASVGVFFGMYPAFKASRLDPIEALRYE